MLSRYLKMFIRMTVGCLAVLMLAGTMQPASAQSPDYDEYILQQPASSAGLFVLDAASAVLSGDAVLQDGAIHIDETGSVTYTFAAEDACAFQLEITCRSIEGKRNDVEYAVLLDGQTPFSEAAMLKIRRVWKSAGLITQNNQGDDIVPEQVLAIESAVQLAQDSDGLYAEPFLFQFAAGEHTLTLDFTRAGIVIEQVRLVPAQTIPSYEAYIAQYAGAASEGAVKYEAELTHRTASPALAPIYDKSSAATTPSSPVNLKLNTIGSYNWEDAGLWIEWEITVPEDGLYDLAFRYRQSLSEGFFSSRKITVDGVLPYRELADVHFEYDNDWQMLRIPTSIYLTAGVHTLRMEATTGVMAEYIKMLQDMILELNTLYRQIIMITGTSPDIFQDYNLKNAVPGMVDTLRASADGLYTLADEIEALSGGDNSEASYLCSVAYQLDDVADRPETMKERLDTFKSNLSALASWMLELKDQPLELDCFYLLGTETETPSANVPFTEEMGYALKSFMASFTRDYSNLGNVYEGEENVTLRVWILGGRDQAQVAKNLIDNKFVPVTGVNVNLELVQGGLTEAILSGNAPDVIMTLGRSDPLNLGIRGALLDLKQFSDYEEVAARFSADANTPYTYKGAVYGLPVTQNFCMMFYRTDIFEEMGLTVPETWEDFFKTVRILQRSNLQVGVPVPSGTTLGNYDLFTAFLYQNGGTIMNEDGTRAVLDSPEAIEAFTTWTNLFVDMGLPLSYDFYSRFRTGEMPLAIQSYTQYNLLMTSAPDLTNLWKMAALPGTMQEDGTIDRSIMSGGTACGISSGCENPEEAWEFIKWWTSAEAQYEYGTQLETLMGAAVRYDTANLEALRMLPWSAEEYEQLYKQILAIREIPETPANYFIYRSLTNAFRKVAYNANVNPREAIVDYNLQINKEVQRKLKEFE